MFIAVVTDNVVREVLTNEAASLEAMSAYANRGERVRRIRTDELVFALYSAGRHIETDLLVVDGRPETTFVAR